MENGVRLGWTTILPVSPLSQISPIAIESHSTEEISMRLSALFLAVLVLPLFAQTKKIVVAGADPVLVKDLESASPKARIVPVTKENVMTEVADADAYVGAIRPEEVRAGKKLQWVQIMSAGAETVLFKSGGNDLRDSNIMLTNNQI